MLINYSGFQFSAIQIKLVEIGRARMLRIYNLNAQQFNRKQIVDLYKVIDIMMALSTELQASFEQKLTNYQEDRKVPLLSNIEIRAIERTRREDIIKLLQKRFGNLPESLVENINQIDDIAVLESLIVETIGVNSPEDFQRLIDSRT